LGYSADSEVALKFGITLMKIVIFLTIAVFFQVIILRAMLVFREYRKKHFINIWRPILMESVAFLPEKLPKLNRRFTLDFIGEWNSLYEKLGGISHDNLIQIARRLDIHKSAIIMLTSGRPRIQLTGIITLGNMKVSGAWDILESISKSEHTILSMAAYRALILIDRNQALEKLLPTLLQRLDWPPSMVARILKDSDTTKVCDLLAKTCENARGKQLANLIRYINALKCMCSLNIFRAILSDPDHDEEVLSLCLAELNDPTAIDLVRMYIAFPSAQVRTYAAVAIGNIGSKEDIILLEMLLNDENWWVRYRAAQSLIGLPFISNEKLSIIKEKTITKRAIEILEQAIAEREFA